MTSAIIPAEGIKILPGLGIQIFRKRTFYAALQPRCGEQRCNVGCNAFFDVSPDDSFAKEFTMCATNRPHDHKLLNAPRCLSFAKFAAAQTRSVDFRKLEP